MTRYKLTIRQLVTIFIVTIGLVLPGQYSFTNPDQIGFQEVALANEASTLSLYLPIVQGGALANHSTIFGVDMGSITHSRGLTEVRQAGVHWMRRGNLRWSEVEPTKGTRKWSVLKDLEQEFIDAKQEGMEVIIIVSSTPKWAQKIPGVFCGPVKEAEFGAFAKFMGDLVKRYSKAPYYVKYWEIWNEPDVGYTSIKPDSQFGCWGDKNDAYFGGGYYGKMLKAVYPAIKNADPNAQVIVGGLLLDCNPNGGCTSNEKKIPPKFLEGILRAGGGPYFDGVSFHAYDYYKGSTGVYSNANWNSAWNTTGPVAIAKTDYIKSLLSKYGASSKFLMNTEAAVICGKDGDPPGIGICDDKPTSPYETTKAYYVTQSYTVGASLGLRANIWYSLYGWRNSGLLYSDRTPRPAYQALYFTRSMLGNAQYQRRITSYSNVSGHEFEKGSQTIWVVWSRDGRTHSMKLNKTPSRVYDAFGNLLPATNPLSVTIKPLFVVWNP